MFGVKFGGVELPRDLPHLQLTVSYPLLEPQAGTLEVPHLAQALPLQMPTAAELSVQRRKGKP